MPTQSYGVLDDFRFTASAGLMQPTVVYNGFRTRSIAQRAAEKYVNEQLGIVGAPTEPTR